MNWQDVAVYGLITTLIVITAVSVNYLPEKVPVHWNAQGQVDAWAGKQSLWMTPLLSLGLLGLFKTIPKIAVKRKVFEKRKEYYSIMIAGLLGFMVILQIGIIACALNPFTDMTSVLFPGLAFLFTVFGWTLRKFEQNYFVGFRTPWALANKKVWKKTQEFGGKSMMLMALVILANTFVKNFFLFFILPLMLWIVAVFAYSYLVYTKQGKKK